MLIENCSHDIIESCKTISADSSFLGEELTIFMIKPDGLRLYENTKIIIQQLDELFTSINLLFQIYKCKTLRHHEILGIYSHLETSDSISLEHKNKLYSHLTSGQVLIGLASGMHAKRKLLKVKQILRKNLAGVAEESKSIYNFIHVPEDYELDVNINVLFYS